MIKLPWQDGGKRLIPKSKIFPFWGLAAIFLAIVVLALVFSFGGKKEEKRGPIPPEALSKIHQEKAKAQKEFAEFSQTPAGKLWQKHPYWDPAVCQKIAEGQVFPGMSKEQAREAVARVEEIKSRKGEKLLEVWAVEGKGKEKWILKFEENALVSVEDR
jgi:hypothetical protein